METNDSGFTILLVDDEEQILFSTRVLLRSAGFTSVLTASDSRQVLPLLGRQPVSLILLDLAMPHLGGYELLRLLQERYSQVPVIIVTAANELEMAVECMKAGAYDYFVKPVEKSRMISGVKRAMEMRAMSTELSSLKRHLLTNELEQEAVFSGIVTCSDAMRGIFHYLEAVAPSDQPVLIAGETGVGKEMFAQALHRASGRTGQFVAVNVAGLDDQMLADTLFGHRKGAFTGADQKRDGLIQQADGGTLFLDEIGDLSESSQIKLLRLLQEQEYFPLGADTPLRSNARIAAATNRPLSQMMADGTFRHDLFYRLNTHRIQVPPLRERQEDIPLLVDHFLAAAARSLGKKKPTPPAELFRYLGNYGFPGNVRELQAMVFDAVARHRHGVLSLDAFKAAMASILFAAPATEPAAPTTSSRLPTLKEAEESLIAEALRLAGGNQGLAASYLGITRQALNKRLNRRPG